MFNNGVLTVATAGAFVWEFGWWGLVWIVLLVLLAGHNPIIDIGVALALVVAGVARGSSLLLWLGLVKLACDFIMLAAIAGMILIERSRRS